MTFNVYRYSSKEVGNFSSMGIKTGNFSIDRKGVKELYKAIASGDMNEYCFIEKKSEYFRLFWDLDIDLSSMSVFNGIDIDKFWTYVISKILGTLKRYIEKKDMNTFKYIYSDRSDISHKLHLYFPNIILNKEYSLLLRKRIVESLNKEKKYNIPRQIYEKIVDPSVFKGNGLRLLFQRKKGQNGYYKINAKKSTLKNIAENRIDQLKLTSLRTARSTINVDLVRSEKSGVPFLEMLKDKVIIKRKMKKETEPFDITVLHKTSYDLKIVSELADNLSNERIDNYESWLSFVFLCRNYGWIDLAHRTSARSNKYTKSAVDDLLKSIPKGGKRGINTIASLIYWSKLDNPEKHEEIMKRHNTSKIFSKSLEYISLDTFEKYADEVYESDHVKPLDLDTYNTFIIKAGTGTGKTERIIESIAKLVKNYRRCNTISVIASRVVLALNIFGRFNIPLHGQTKPLGLGMILYSDVESKDLHKEGRLVQTPDSLIHMIRGEKVNYPNIVFVDEIESLYNYVCTSSTLEGKRREVFTILNAYIKNATYVFLVDSNVTTLLCDHIKHLRKDHPINVIYNKKKTNKIHYYITYDEYYFKKQVSDSIKRGEKIFIGTDSKKQTELLQDELDTLNIKVYNSDTDDESRSALCNVNKEWSKYDVVICSPTILYGCDYNVEHFDRVFGYYTKTITANSVYQQLNRVRKIKSEETYIYVKDYLNTNIHPMPTTSKRLGEYLFRYENEYVDELKMLAFDYEELHKLNENDLFTKLYIHFMIEINKCGNNFEQRLVKYLTEFGGKVSKIVHTRENYRDKTQFRKELLTRSKKVDKKRNKELVKASNHMKSAAIIHQKKSKTTEDRRILTASKICNQLRLRKLNAFFVEKMKHIGNVDSLVESFAYFDELCVPDVVDNKMALFNKKRTIIKEGNKLFFEDGILSKNIIDVPRDELSPCQRKWMDKNLDDILHCFKSARSDRIKIDSQVNLLKLIDRLNREFFAGYLSFNCIRKRKKVNKKMFILFETSINCHEFIELYLNAKLEHEIFDKPELINQIISYKDTKCLYQDLHGFRTIGCMIASYIRETEDFKIAETVEFLD